MVWINQLRSDVSGRSRRGMLAAVVGSLLVGGLASCDTDTVLGVYNGCGFPIDVATNTINDVRVSTFNELDEGERYTWLASEASTEFFVWVRVSEGEPVKEFTVQRDELVPPPEEYDHDLEIVVEGDRCPVEDGP